MKYFGIALTLLFAVALCAAETLPLNEFLNRARRPAAGATYAALEGKVQHLRRGEQPQTEPIYFAVILQPERTTGQIIIGGKEGYLLGQTRGSGESETSVVPMRGSAAENSLLDRMGVRASDLTMSFLYYPALKELEPETIRTIPCRIVLLEAPDKSEQAKVYIARDYFFPLKAEFFKPGESTPYRTLEVNSFRKLNDLYYTDELSLSGPGWRTRINFDKSADVAPFNPSLPPSIIRQL